MILGGCLKVNPEHRLTISAILERLAAIAETNNYNLKAPIEITQTKTTDFTTEQSHVNSNHIASVKPPPSQPSPAHQPPPRPSQPHRPAPPPQRPTMPPPPLQQQRVNETKQTSGLFSSIRGGAGSFLKNLKDTSSKVMQTMQQ